MWRSLKHKFVLPFSGIHEIEDATEPRFVLVSPYMKNGTLSRWRKQANPSMVEVKERVGSLLLPILRPTLILMAVGRSCERIGVHSF